MNTSIGFIGGGNMAASLIGGLLSPAADQVRMRASHVWVYDKDPDKMSALQAAYGLQRASDSEQLISECAVVVLAVKPQVLQAVLGPLADSLQRCQPLLISVVAGIRIETIERWIGGECALVRVMPNTPALVGAGASGMYANTRVSSEQKDIASNLLESVGMTAWLDHEHEIDLVTALSGSGPAYFMLFMQSLITAAVNAGLDAKTAKALTLQTAAGAAELIRQSDQSVGTLVKNITSPGGTTERALMSFEKDGLAAIVENAFAAALSRSQQLAVELDD